MTRNNRNPHIQLTQINNRTSVLTHNGERVGWISAMPDKTYMWVCNASCHGGGSGYKSWVDAYRAFRCRYVKWYRNEQHC